jgi:hypothetical protein
MLRFFYENIESERQLAEWALPGFEGVPKLSDATPGHFHLCNKPVLNLIGDHCPKHCPPARRFGNNSQEASCESTACDVYHSRDPAGEAVAGAASTPGAVTWTTCRRIVAIAYIR